MYIHSKKSEREVRWDQVEERNATVWINPFWISLQADGGGREGEGGTFKTIFGEKLITRMFKERRRREADYIQHP